MSGNTSWSASASPQDQFMRTLEYKAPFLIEKLLKEQIVASESEAESLFVEVLRYIVIDRAYPGKHFQMYSRRIDEVWHQFVLFTREYSRFCMEYLGAFLDHYPSNAPGLLEQSITTSTAQRGFVEFRQHYERLFQEQLPMLWLDRKNVTVDRRVLRDHSIGSLSLEQAPESVALLAPQGRLFSVGTIAAPALEFALRTNSFYVRELPGLEDEEKIGLVEVLVGNHVLMVGS